MKWVGLLLVKRGAFDIRIKNTGILLFFIVFYLLGLKISEDYGISWDENVRRIGSISHAKEVAQLVGINHPSFLNIPDVKDNIHAWTTPYGMIYEFPALLIELIIGSENIREVFLYRHKLIFTFHFLGIIAFFFFSKEVFVTNNKAFLSTLVYSLHPRIFAHSFFNPKDIIFLAVLTLSLFPIIKFYKTKQIKWLIISSISIGLAMSCRIVGLYMPFLIIIFYSINEWIDYRTFDIKNILSNISICVSIILISFFILYLFTPYYWSHPIQSFIETFQSAKQFPWSGNVFFLGDSISAKSIPWFYLPVWLIISTPVSYIIFFLIGIILLIKQNRYNYQKNFIFYFCLSAIIIPYVFSIFLGSTLYDGWRHFYFLYSFISIITSYAIINFYNYIIYKLNNPNTNYIKIGTILLIFFSQVISIFSMHPHQQVYFNFLAGKDPMTSYEGDYWGPSYRQGLEFIVNNDSRDLIYIKIGNSPGSLNRHIINEYDRKRLHYNFMVNESNNKNADYYITNFRDSVSDYSKAKQGKYPYNNEVFSVDIGEMKIMGVYKIDKTQILPFEKDEL